MRNFGDTPSTTTATTATWSGNTVNPQYTVATGSSLNYLQWDFFFNGSPTAFVMDYLAYGVAGNLLGATEITYDGCGTWHYADIGCGRNDYDRCPVPLPPSALLMGSGLVGLVGLGWRRKKSGGQLA
jgi:hypothetical protein